MSPHSLVRTAVMLRTRVLLAPLCLSLLSACGTLERINEGSKIDYKSTAQVSRRSTLDVPPDLATPRSDDRFALPQGPRGNSLSQFERERQAAVGQRTEGQGVLPAVPGVRVERSGNQRWLVVDQAPAQLWPVVKDFWEKTGFTLATLSPETGIMETEWAENRAKLPDDIVRRTIGRVLPNIYSTSERDRFRTRLEPAAGGGTEIYVSHRGMTEVYTNERKESTVWQPRPVDPELEAEFMRRLMVRIGGDRTDAAQVAALAPAQAPQRAALANDLLSVREPFDRAWRRVGVALDRVGFTVEDRDRSKGLYFVRFVDTEPETGKKPGVLSRLFGGGADKAANAQRYQLNLQAAGEATELRVLSAEGTPLQADADRRVSARILTLLHEQLR